MESFGGYIGQSWSERSRESFVSVCNVGTQLSLQRKALQSCESSSSVADSNTPKIKATQCHRRLNLGSGSAASSSPQGPAHAENSRGICLWAVSDHPVSRDLACCDDGNTYSTIAADRVHLRFLRDTVVF